MPARRLMFALVLLAVAASAFAANPRTFVASYGNDANPCTLTQPCRSNAGEQTTPTTGNVVPVNPF